jgi:hypothetical protein
MAGGNLRVMKRTMAKGERARMNETFSGRPDS